MTDTAASTGLVLIRLALGLMLVTHGTNKMFGTGGISGTARWFEGLGLRPGIVHAWAAATTEVGAGALMSVGLLLPAASAGFVGLMTVAALTDHGGKGFFVFKGGWEYVVLVAAVAAALTLIGPGQWSLDHLIGTEVHGLGWGVLSLVGGLAAGLGTVVIFRTPVAKEQPA
jgi:putative oxidoreductase